MTHVVVMGNIGVGKSSLVEALYKHILEKHPERNAKRFAESVDEMPYLDDYYNDPPEYAMRFQFDVLATRYNQHKTISAHTDSFCIQDGSIYNDIAFVNVLNKTDVLDDRDTKSYLRLHQIMLDTLKIPSIFVYLYTDIDTLLARIAERGRTCESGITKEYLTLLEHEYETLYNSLSQQTACVKIDWTTFKTPDEIAAIFKKMGI